MYKKYSEFLKNRYNSKVYKIPLSIKASCPVRDGLFSSEGCAFCGEKAAGYENHESDVSIETQIKNNLEIFTRKYKAEKFILYFQNFTNTYISLSEFKKNILTGLRYCDNVVAISISTRPDCIDKEYLDFLDEIKNEYNIDIIIELGLQSVNNNTLLKLDRHHTLADYIKAVMLIKKYNFMVSTHIIASIPFDSELDIIEAGKLLSILDTDIIKIHSLYIEEGTKLANMYKSRSLKPLKIEEFVDRVVLLLENLDSKIAVERLVSRVPSSEDILFLNWGRSHWVIIDMIEEKMKEKNTYQGKEYDKYNEGILTKFK